MNKKVPSMQHRHHAHTHAIKNISSTILANNTYDLYTYIRWSIYHMCVSAYTIKHNFWIHIEESNYRLSAIFFMFSADMKRRGVHGMKSHEDVSLIIKMWKSGAFWLNGSCFLYKLFIIAMTFECYNLYRPGAKEQLLLFANREQCLNQFLCVWAILWCILKKMNFEPALYSGHHIGFFMCTEEKKNVFILKASSRCSVFISISLFDRVIAPARVIIERRTT